MIELNLVRFAYNKGDKPTYIILNDQHYDNYITGESGKWDGYGTFEYLGDVTIEEDTLREIAACYNSEHSSPYL
jgi:hypothetical protein